MTSDSCDTFCATTDWIDCALFAAGRIGMDLTAGSTLNYLIVAGVVCAGLWAIIILTITA